MPGQWRNYEGPNPAQARGPGEVGAFGKYKLHMSSLYDKIYVTVNFFINCKNTVYNVNFKLISFYYNFGAFNFEYKVISI